MAQLADAQQHWSIEIAQDLLSAENESMQNVDFRLSSQHTSSSSGVHYVYLQQQFQAIDIEYATLALGFDESRKVISFQPSALVEKSRLIGSKVEQGIKLRAWQSIATDLQLPLGKIEISAKRSQKEQASYRISSISDELISVKQLWVPIGDGLVLAHDVRFHAKGHAHHWKYLIDASTGDIIRKKDQVLHCHFSSSQHLPKTGTVDSHPADAPAVNSANNNYRVFPLYVESPSHGRQIAIKNPADPIASPFGWHDVNGQDGAEFFDTRGNNAFVQEDRDSDDRSGARADGGLDLNFDFAFTGGRPDQYLDASLTNLFYWVNINHDLFYHYGFDEAAGNFQVNNYGKGGRADDPIVADAQDGSSRNNATFFTNNDGRAARMEMYIWSPSVF